MSEMIERLVQAAWTELERQAQLLQPDTRYVGVKSSIIDGTVDMPAVVRAIVEAMHEPTPSIVEAVTQGCTAWECFRADGSEWEVADVWKAMQKRLLTLD